MTAGGYQRAEDLPGVIPVFPLNGVLLLPGAELPLNIFEPRYLNMIDDAMGGERLIGMIQTGAMEPTQFPKPGTLAQIGCVGRITSYSETGDGRYLITLTGICRFKVAEELKALKPYREVRADFATFENDLVEDAGSPPEVSRTDKRVFFEALRRYLYRRGLALDWQTAEAAPADALVGSLSMALPFDPAEKQALLEAPTPRDRYEALLALLAIDAEESPDDGPPSVQ